MAGRTTNQLSGSGRYSTGLEPVSQLTTWIPIAVVLIISLLALVGRVIDITILKSIKSEWIAMKVITAICLIFSVTALVLINIPKPSFLKYFITKVLIVILFMISLITVTFNIFVIFNGKEPAIAQLPFLNLLLSDPNRIALITAFIFLLIACILFLLSLKKDMADNIAHIIVLPTAMVSYFIPVTYLFGVDSLQDLPNTPIALNSGIAFCAFCAAVLIIRPNTWFTKVFSSNYAGSIVARRLFPGLMLLPIIIGWLRIIGEQKGLFKSEVGVIFVALTYTFCFILLLWLIAKSVNQTDEKRRVVEEALRSSESNLRAILDVTKVEEALRESEERVRLKLKSILSPEGEIGILSLSDIFDTKQIQSLMDNFYKLTPIPMAIIDDNGKVLIGVGWQDICTQFHRKNPLACKNCIESDTILTKQIPEGEFQLYKCRNGMWDMATPIIIGDRHMGNLFIGQFFFDDEEVNYDYFRLQAAKYGFDEKEYISALENVPRLSRQVVESAKSYFLSLSLSLSQLSYSNLKLARNISERKRAEEELLQLNRTLNSLGKSSQAMTHADNELQYLDKVCRIIMEDCGHALVWIGYTQDDADKTVLPVASSGFDEGYINNLKITWADTERGRGPTGIAIRTGKPAICANMLTDPNFEPWSKEATERGYASSIVLPLISDGKTFGAVSIYSKETNPFSEDEINLLMTLANDMAYGITNIRLIESEKKATASIKESEEKYHQLFDGMTEGFALHEIITDKKGNPCDYRFLSINPAFEKQTGLKAEDITGKNISEIFPVTEKFWKESYGKVAMSGENIEFENYSSELNSYFKVSAFMPQQGYVAAIFENITKRMLAERDLKSTKEYLESLINNANAPIIVWNTKNMIELFNHAAEHLTGYTSEDVEGKKLDLLFPKTSLTGSKEKIRQSLTSNMETIEIPILTKNKEIRTVLWNSAQIFDENRNVLSTIGQGNDITERLNAETAVMESKLKLDLALENGNIGIWEWDIRTDLFYLDERMEKMFGLETGSFEKTYSAFEKNIYEEDIPHMRNAFHQAIEEDIPLNSIYRIRLKNDDFNYISTKALVEKDNNGKQIKMSGVCFDITEMKKGTEKALFKLNEDLLRSNKELEQFAYIASHDLQEPLRMISSFTQLLSLRYKDKLDKDAQEFIQYAVDGAIRMQALINDLLEYSRVETKGKTFSTIDMHSVLGQTIKNLSRIISEKNAVVINDDLPIIIANEGQMVQLFQNLIGNALKFCDISPVVHISVKEEKEYYIFSVEDNGIGMESQYFNKIFQIFQRLQPKDQYGGTGIGLAICKRITERHGGKIWVVSGLGKGSKFYFSISKNVNNN